jgi:hypothetical protein
MKKLIYSILSIYFICTSCATIEPYEKQYVSDPEMQMGTDPGKSFNNYVFSIREGATPAESSKSSGGCGCN